MRPAAVHRLAAIALALTILPGHGCLEEDEPYLPTPVTALGAVLELEDGSVRAELAVFSTALLPHAPIEQAEPVSVTGPWGTASLALDPARGLYTVTDNDALRYAPGESYRFELTIEEPVALAMHVYSGRFHAAGHGPLERTRAWAATASVKCDEHLRVDWSPSALPAIVELVDPSGRIEQIHTPAVGEQGDPWRRLATGGFVELDGFEAPGRYMVRVCAVDVARRDGLPSAGPQHLGSPDSLATGLGSGSGVAVGRCDAVAVDVTAG